MRPRVEAMRQLDLIDATAAGSGAMQSSNRRSYMGRLRSRARGGGPAPGATRPRTLGEWASKGMQIVEEAPQPPQEARRLGVDLSERSAPSSH